MVALNFNAQQFAPQYGAQGGFPVGKHKVVIAATAPQNVEKEGRIVGGYLALELVGIEGAVNGVKHTDRLNLHHAKPDVVDIANKQLSAYCYVTGVFMLQDSDQLCNRPFMVEVGLQKGQPEGGFTEIKRLFDLNGNEPGKAVAVAHAANSAAPPPAAAPPAEVQAQGAWGGAPAPVAVDSGVAMPPPAAAPAPPAAVAPAVASVPVAGAPWGGGAAPAAAPWGAPA